ncbi:MAG: methionyl-tRNA formyltransferase [Pseudomonadota bacterium]
MSDPARLKLVFMGTPAMAVPALNALAGAGHDLVLAVTQPDRPAGRGRKLRRGEVAAAADALGLTVAQPARAREITGLLAAIAPDALAVMAFGQLLPPELLAIPRLGAVNVHTSLLPALRGAAPIQRAVLNGLTETGVTTMLMDAGLDTGAILLQRATPIGDQETAGGLGQRLAMLGAELLVQTLAGLAEGSVKPTPQDHARATIAPRLSKDEGLIDWARPARELDWLVRGADPWPGAYTFLAGQPLRLFAPTLVIPGPVGAEPGTILAPPPGGDWLLVACGDGALGVGQAQAAGKRRLAAGDFQRGARLTPGLRLGAA